MVFLFISIINISRAYFKSLLQRLCYCNKSNFSISVSLLRYYKLGQVLQIGAKFITNWGRYYKLEQIITNWGTTQQQKSIRKHDQQEI